jgi:hypothetical protein
MKNRYSLSLRKTRLKKNQTVDLYKLHLDADEDFNIIATSAEMKYCQENKAQIKKMRAKAKSKDAELCRSDISEKGEIKMPIPNHQHCGCVASTMMNIKRTLIQRNMPARSPSAKHCMTSSKEN